MSCGGSGAMFNGARGGPFLPHATNKIDEKRRKTESFLIV